MRNRPHPGIASKLDELHRQYGDWNQAESENDRIMAANGHPLAPTYRRLRRLFDGLRYAANAGARFFSYGGKGECSEYWGPGLGLDWRPTGALQHFGCVYPADARWRDYMVEAAAAGWPDCAGPRLNSGSWIVHTANADLHAALLALQSPGLRVVRHDDHVRVWLSGDTRAPAQMAAVLRLLRRYHRPWILPPRTGADDAADLAPLPLAEKRFALGKVSEVTVTARMVLVPLIPISPAGQELALRSADRLVALVKQGFPFAQAAAWLRGQLSAERFADLARRHGAAEPQ